MAEFDPYLKWLGIRDKTRPVNHYRLLGLDLYESDRDVISMAADRQMAHIRTYQNGPNGNLSQHLLNELARARRCLLVDEKRLAYDQKLRQHLAQLNQQQAPPIQASTAPAVPTQPPVIAAEVVPTVVPTKSDSFFESGPSIGVRSDPDVRTKTKKRERRQLLWSLFGWITGGVAAIGVGALLINSGLIGGGGDDGSTGKNPKVATKENTKKTSSVTPKTDRRKSTSKADNENINDLKNSNTNEVDLEDLTLVDGIGLATQFVLQSQEIKSLTQLAGLSPYDVATALKRSNFKDTEIKLGDYQDWIGQAKNFIGDSTPIKDALSNQQIADLEKTAAEEAKLIAANANENNNSETASDPSAATKKKFVLVGASLPVVSKKPIASRSLSGAKYDEKIVFFNELEFPVDVFWVNQKGDKKRYFTLNSGEKRTQFCRDNSAWHVARKNKSAIGTYLARKGENSAVIDGRNPDSNAIVENPAPNNTPPSKTTVAKLEIPSASSRNDAKKKLKKELNDPLEQALLSDHPENRRTVERLLLIVDGTYASDPASQFALLETAKEIALVRGDSDTVLKVLRELDTRFDKFDFWDEVNDAIEDSGRKIRVTGKVVLASQLEKNIRELIDEAMKTGKTRSASQLADFAMRAASRRGDTRTQVFYQLKSGHIKEYAKLKKQNEVAEKTLAADDKDPKANLIHGQFLLANDDVDGALKHWANSKENKYLDLVKALAEAKEKGVATLALPVFWEDVESNPKSLVGSMCRQQAIKVLNDYIKENRLRGASLRDVASRIQRIERAMGM